MTYSQFKLRQYFVLFMLFRFFGEVWIIDFQIDLFAISFIFCLLDHLLCLATLIMYFNATLIMYFIHKKRIVFITKLHNVL